VDLIGLDLGQMQSFAAAAVLRSTTVNGPDGQPLRTSAGGMIRRFDVMALKRYRLGTSFSAIVEHIAAQARRRELHADGPPRICVDKTGCGAAVLETLRTAIKTSPTIECWGIVITAGKAVTRPGPHEVHVAKTELAGAIRQVLEDGRLRVPPQLEFAEALRRELQGFTVRVTAAANETFSAAEGKWDDLVIAAALPIWLSGWLDTRQGAVLGKPGPRVFPGGYRPSSHAVTMGGNFEFRGQLFGRDPSDWRRGPGASPYRR
jgi:hypothetical protein